MAADDHTAFDQEQYDLLLECTRTKDVVPWNIYRTGHSFVRIQLQATSLEEAYLVEANLRDANFREANLREANLVGAKLGGANLEGANLAKAKLVVADLAGANLAGANLAGANLAGAKLEGAKLEGTNLEGAKLEGTNLEVAILEKTNLEGIELEGADLEIGEQAPDADSQIAEPAYDSLQPEHPDRLTNNVELVVNLADDISYEEAINLLTSITGLSSGLAGLSPALNEIRIGKHTDEHAAASIFSMGNRISLNLAKNIAETLSGIFFGMPAVKAREAHADADMRKSEASMEKAEAFDCMLEFLEKAGISEKERKAIVVDQITSGDRRGNMLEHLQIISDLVERKRINFQIAGQTNEPDRDQARKPTLEIPV